MFMNILSLYHFTHLGLGKKVDFTPDSMSIFDMHDNSKIIIREVNHKSWLCTFSNFIEPDSSVLITHVYDSSRLWHKRFGHLNFRYMHHLARKGWSLDYLISTFPKGFVKDVFLVRIHKRI